MHSKLVNDPELLIKKIRLIVIWILAIGGIFIAYKVAQGMADFYPERFPSPYIHGVGDRFQSKGQYFASMRRAFLQCTLGVLPLLFIFDYAAWRLKKRDSESQLARRSIGIRFSELGGFYVFMMCAWFMFSHTAVAIRFEPSIWRPNPSFFYPAFFLAVALWLGVFLYNAIVLSSELDRSKGRRGSLS